MDKHEYTVFWPFQTPTQRRRTEKEINTSLAAALYHAMYPRSNFFLKSMDTQRQFEEVAKRLF